MCLAVPLVATILNPNSRNSLAKSAIKGLSESRTLKNTEPE